MPAGTLSAAASRSRLLQPLVGLTTFVGLYFLAAPLIFGDNGYVLNVLTTTAMVAFISLGVWLTFAIGRINMAQAGFCLIGGYASAIIVTRLGWSFWLSLPLAGCASASVGAAIGWPVLRLKGVYFAMLTLCITEACRLAALSFPDLTQGAQGIVDLPLPGGLSLFGLSLIPPFDKGARLPFFFLSGAILTLGLVFLWLVDSSQIGAVFRSLRQNEDLAASLGVNVPRYRLVAFVIACFYGGVGGAFFSAMQQNVYPTTFQVIDSVYFMVYCFVGGLEFIIGPLVGAFLLSTAFELLVELQRYQTIVFSSLMILCILFMPNGVLSVVRRRSPGMAAPDGDA